mgnify:CR=1 FL=1
MENERKLQRAEAIRLNKKKEWQRRRHLGIKRKRTVVNAEELDFGDFEDLFPKTPIKTLHVMKKIIGGDTSDNGFDPAEFYEYEDWDYPSLSFDSEEVTALPDEKV